MQIIINNSNLTQFSGLHIQLRGWKQSINPAMQLRDENLQISGKSQIFQSFLLSLKMILHNDNAMNLKTRYNKKFKI